MAWRDKIEIRDSDDNIHAMVRLHSSVNMAKWIEKYENSTLKFLGDGKYHVYYADKYFHGLEIREGKIWHRG